MQEKKIQTVQEGPSANLSSIIEAALDWLVRAIQTVLQGMMDAILGFAGSLVISAAIDSLFSMKAPAWAFLGIGELVIAGYIQDAKTILRRGVVYTLGMAIGLSLVNDWIGVAFIVAVYAVVTWYRFKSD